jgi:biotin transport system substrate-specific component
MDNMAKKEITNTEAAGGRNVKRKTITGLTLTALFAALIAAGTFVSIPVPFSPVPIVLQNLFVVLAGLILGPAMGTAAVGLYLAAGIIGAPVFAGASGGIACFAGPTGGFLVGYLLAGLTAGLAAGFPRPEQKISRRRLVMAVAAGFLVVYVPGVAWLRIYIGGNWAAALTAGLVPFIPGDIIKAVIAAVVSPRLRRTSADLLSR